MDGARELVHGTAVAVGNRAALIRGASGAGKSDLALRCLATPVSLMVPEPVRLVADDQVVLTRDGGQLMASAPDTIRGRMEVRGVGIVPVPAVEQARLVLVADIVAAGDYARMPEACEINLLGVAVPRIAITPFECSAAVKLLMCLNFLEHGKD